MKRRNLISIFLLLILFLFTLSGCGIDDIVRMKQEHDLTEAKLAENENVKLLISQTTELNDRQKRIMQWEGVTTDYSQMNDEQKEAAIKIEMLYQYLDEKYPGKEFEYVCFWLNPISADLIVKETSDEKHRDVSASLKWDNKEKTYIFSDSYYMVTTASDEYEKLIEKHLKEYNPKTKFFLDVEVHDVDNENQTVNIANTGGSITIVIENCFADEEAGRKYVADLVDWLNENNAKYGAMIKFIALSEEDFSNASYFNYMDCYYFKDKEVFSFNCKIEDDGKPYFW
ncbi:hypothetical protein SAMN02910298_01946 [Pseudobutyrivibrio sp. YE44]|uniref:hypothetical protein n=1 Tax=Pseudobutyrivibrio sp. YE44 TaxID=1520802 RepID=UPI00089054C5|nr:hypothetical protein [Pseudobutyrivibrio sp. YE44]SDB39943.1 hypothetical protein SAMN02910298_01946 [Pseudobutyrivibrio sp. YE44]